jgi:hypothetical protein
MATAPISPSASAQDASVSLGDLICSVGPSTKSESAAVLDSQNVICLFTPLENGPEETYTGTLLTAGRNDDFGDQSAVIWAVRGSGSRMARAGMLEQTFTGSVADPDGAKGPLVGDVDISVGLHLMSRHDNPQPGKPATASIELKLKSGAG